MQTSRARASLFSACLAAAIFAASAAVVTAATEEPAEPALGIDVSHHSGEIDWDQVATEGLAFVYLKATEGVDAADPMFESHWERLGELGIPRGAYHFYVTEDDPVEQAEFFLSRVELGDGDLAPVVDVEVIGRGTTGEISPKLQKYLDVIEKRTGATPIIYTSAKFWDAHFEPSFGRYPLWVAEYDVGQPAIPHGWGEWLLWQFEGDVDVPGIEKGADRSIVRQGADVDHLKIGADRSPSDG